MPASTPTPQGPTFLESVKQLNRAILSWTGSLTWARMAILWVIVLIAGSWISDRLSLHHSSKLVKVSVPQQASTESVVLTENITGCGESEITINGKKFVIGCENTTSVSTVPAAAGSAPKGASSAPVATKEDKSYAIKVREAAHQPPEIREERQTVHTLGGYIGDMSSALLVGLFAYLIAAKIIVRKTAESDAKVREATSTAEEEALQRQLVQARLKLLQAQVEPHFLFNTLAAVDYLIETDPPRASVMQKQLITYLRGALPQMREDSSTMGREVSLVKAYLELLKMRIEDRLEFQIDVPESLNGAVFPPMVLQTVVENAIKHGIEPKPEGGKITIHAQARDGNLWIDVIDTGVGLPEGDVFGKSTNGTGLGLDNIRTRLALLYPGASRIELRSEIPSGTSVRIMVPYQTESTAKASA